MSLNTIIIILCFLFLVYLSIRWFRNHIKENLMQSDPIIQELKNTLAPIFPKITTVKIFESEGKSYTINKERVFLCIKDKNNEYYSKNMLLYVLLHEYAHVINDEIGHTEKFHTLFDQILEQAADAGIYDPNVEPVKDYCEHKSE